jgi:choline dehydrogenase
VVAVRLADAGRDVCLVEAGPDYGPYAEGRWPADILDSPWLAFSHAWETEREDRSQLRARIMGGCSAHNACVVLAGAPADYDEWGHGWSHAAIEPYLRRAEEMLRVRRLAAEELSPWHSAFARAAGTDAILHPTNVVDGVRWNAAFAYVDPVRERLTVLADTLVDRVILSAGAYGSPGILLRSDIGAQRGLPVGEGLLDHVGVGLGFEPTARLGGETTEFERDRPLSMAQVTVQARSSACEEGVCDLYLFPAVDPAVDGVYEISVAAFAMKPRSRGSVRLISRDPSAPLAIDHGFLSDARDVDVLVEGVEAIRALAARGPVSDYVAREVRPGPEVAAVDHVRAAARGFFHPTGTCAIGRVVDGDGGVLGIDGLHVVDA